MACGASVALRRTVVQIEGTGSKAVLKGCMCGEGVRCIAARLRAATLCFSVKANPLLGGLRPPPPPAALAA
ncbi:hypothetical protein EVAR_48228_1 [Eumeta japonica]|uniref:Uncharacterized protein n=1 Tax=Eumeta variegata TaxID=151549 RepID=A0A4C1YHQ6_EUMVA|nr:hypothetical protein EVAR_48228_1 [Eumeta japonica]